jgi:DNA-binding XRE family transcriptional regulator
MARNDGGHAGPVRRGDRGHAVSSEDTIPLVETIGRNVKRQRERRAWTQERLAVKAGIHRVSLARIEAGTKTPSLDLLARLARALRVKPGRLLD